MQCTCPSSTATSSYKRLSLKFVWLVSQLLWLLHFSLSWHSFCIWTRIDVTTYGSSHVWCLQPAEEKILIIHVNTCLWAMAYHLLQATGCVPSFCGGFDFKQVRLSTCHLYRTRSFDSTVHLWLSKTLWSGQCLDLKRSIITTFAFITVNQHEMTCKIVMKFMKISLMNSDNLRDNQSSHNWRCTVQAATICIAIFWMSGGHNNKDWERLTMRTVVTEQLVSSLRNMGNIGRHKIASISLCAITTLAIGLTITMRCQSSLKFLQQPVLYMQNLFGSDNTVTARS